MYGVLTGVLLVAGVQIWRGYSAVEPWPIPWANEVALWEKNHGYSLRIMPPGHTVHLR
jgi:hypothetical protein